MEEQKWEESEKRREEKEERRSEKGKGPEKESKERRTQTREKTSKVAIHCVFSHGHGLWFRRVESRFAKSGRCGAIWPGERQKIARRCGANKFRHFEVKMHKTHTILGPFLEAEMLKKCTLLWRETHFEVNNGKKNDGF